MSEEIAKHESSHLDGCNVVMGVWDWKKSFEQAPDPNALFPKNGYEKQLPFWLMRGCLYIGTPNLGSVSL